MKPKLFISFLCGCLVVFVLGLTDYGVTNKTVNGFTILSVGVTVGVEWEARER